MLVTYEDHTDWYHFYTAHDKVYMDLNKAKERKAYVFNHLDEDIFNKAEGRCVGAWIKEADLDESHDFKLAGNSRNAFFENDLFLGGYEE